MGVRHDDKTSCVTGTEKKEAGLILGVVRVEPGDRQGVAECGRRFFEGEIMFGDVSPSLFRIPLEVHFRHSLELARLTIARSAAARKRQSTRC
jgi:hypothetical protein